MSRLLDSEDVLEAINEIMLYYSDCGITEGQQIAEDVVDGIRTAERKKGTWVFKNCVWWCSECGKNPTKGTGYVQRAEELFDYCPHCGADMKEGEHA